MDDRCFGYTIYKNPSDVPNHYVMRGWDIEDGTMVPASEAIAVPVTDLALATLRQSLLDMGLVCMGRQPDDDPVILEVWI